MECTLYHVAREFRNYGKFFEISGDSVECICIVIANSVKLRVIVTVILLYCDSDCSKIITSLKAQILSILFHACCFVKFRVRKRYKFRLFSWQFWIFDSFLLDHSS